MDTIIVKILFLIFACIGYLLMVFSIPGNFITLGIGLLYLLAVPDSVSTGAFIALALMAISGEVVENVVSVLGAKKGGAGKRGMIGAFFGGILGGILGTMVAPVIGTFIGVFAGSFLLTYFVETYFEKKSSEDAHRAGMGAMLGKIAAVSYKYSIGLVMIAVLGFSLFT